MSLRQLNPSETNGVTPNCGSWREKLASMYVQYVNLKQCCEILWHMRLMQLGNLSPNGSTLLSTFCLCSALSGFVPACPCYSLILIPNNTNQFLKWHIKVMDPKLFKCQEIKLCVMCEVQSKRDFSPWPLISQAEFEYKRIKISASCSISSDGYSSLAQSWLLCSHGNAVWMENSTAW